MRNLDGGCVTVLLGLIAILVIAIAIAAFEAWIFMLLWNWLAVAYFSAPVLEFLPAWGILILLNIIGSAFKAKVIVESK